jgi:hypothetical protein
LNHRGKNLTANSRRKKKFSRAKMPTLIYLNQFVKIRAIGGERLTVHHSPLSARPEFFAMACSWR